MKINWFSPLPPALTAIATYTANLLPFLKERADVTLWTDQDVWDKSLTRYAKVQPYQLASMPWQELAQADANIYHIGNHIRFHSSIFEVSQRHPGIVVLHDVRLQQLFRAFYYQMPQREEEYAAQMERHHSSLGRYLALACSRGKFDIEYLAEQYPLTTLATENSQGVVVHTQEAFTALREKSRSPLVYIPLPYADRDAENASENIGKARRASSHSKPFVHLIVFGHIGSNRRLSALLQAIAGLSEKDRFHLDIYGQLWDKEYVNRRIKSLGLQRQVKIHGFVSDSVLDAALAKSDLAVNLRYPIRGEASYSQLQIWSHALPSLVTRIGPFADFPKDTVAFVEIEREIADIQRHLRMFLVEPERFAALGRNGYQFLKEHHKPQSYVASILALAEKISTLPKGD